MATRETIPTQSRLLARLKDPEDHDAWQEFLDAYGGLIQRLSLKAGLSEDEAKDVAQEVYIGLVRTIHRFKYDRARCSFKHWLSRGVRWRIRDRLRRRLPTSESDSPPAESQEAPSGQVVLPELEAFWDEEWRRNIIEVATRRVRDKSSAKQFQIYYLHVLGGLAVPEVMRRLHVSRTQVYLAKLRVGRVFREELRQLDE